MIITKENFHLIKGKKLWLDWFIEEEYFIPERFSLNHNAVMGTMFYKNYEKEELPESTRTNNRIYFMGLTVMPKFKKIAKVCLVESKKKYADKITYINSESDFIKILLKKKIKVLNFETGEFFPIEEAGLKEAYHYLLDTNTEGRYHDDRDTVELYGNYSL